MTITRAASRYRDSESSIYRIICDAIIKAHSFVIIDLMHRNPNALKVSFCGIVAVRARRLLFTPIYMPLAQKLIITRLLGDLSEYQARIRLMRVQTEITKNEFRYARAQSEPRMFTDIRP